MSEQADQPVADVPAGADTGVAADAPAATEDIDTEAFDRVEAPDDDDDAGSADGGEPGDDPASGKQPTDAEADTVEIERNGQKYRVPKALEGEILMHADYTKKTMAHAETVRNWESERAQQTDSVETFRADHIAIHTKEGELAKINDDLGKYRLMTAQDWNELKAQDPTLYAQHTDNFDILRRTKLSTEETLEEARTSLKAKEEARTTERTAADQAKLKAEWTAANTVLAKQIPGWGADKFKEIGTFAMKEFGVSAEDLQRAADPVAWTMANRLMKAEAELTTLKKAAGQKVTAEATAKTLEVKPAAKPAGAGASPRGVTDNLGNDEWMRRRNAQVAKRRAG